MAFHVACPITCRKICFCAVGFPEKLRSEKGRAGFLEEVARVEQFLNDPWLIKSRENATIQVKVPKVVVSQTPPPPPAQFVGAGGEVDEAASGASAQVKRAALQKQAAAASMVAEDYARRFESGDLKDAAGEEQGHSNAKILCRLCFSGENEGSERASKMLPCNSCGKKYHRGCVKVWSKNRDLFHWSSWSCPSCRTCEVCRRTGDPNKFMFCKRCDGAYHCYCQHPPHKNVGQGPYLCPKHTKCHSCGSSVPGNGLSVRWFLGYTCCDACGRLFVKGNYCPVCLKVYRDSESTPMVCCDICQSWVHCPCDGISDEKYMQFQVDGNLQYVCVACRGECSKIRSLEEAVPELWKRRDEADKDLIASLRAAAGLPTQEEIFDISPFSDDEEIGPFPSKNEYGRTLKFSVKGLGDKSPKWSKESGKKSSKKPSKKKENETSSKTNSHQSTRGQDDDMIRDTGDNIKSEKTQFSGELGTFSPVAGSAVDATAVSKRKYADEVMVTSVAKAPRTIRIKSNKSHGLINGEEIKTDSGVPKAAQGPKLVIHLGGRGKNRASPLRSDTSSLERGQDLTSSNGSMLYGKNTDLMDQAKGTSKLHDKRRDSIKVKTVKSELSSIISKHSGGEFTDAYESVSPKNTLSTLGKRRTEDASSMRSGPEYAKRNKYSSTKDAEDGSIAGVSIDDNSSTPSASEAPTKGHRPYLKFKIPKNPNAGSQNVSTNLNAGSSNPFPIADKDEMTCTRGQRSKRRRAAPGDEDASQWHEDSAVKDFADANWILQKLGKDAAGKRVEIHHPSDDSWHRGTVMGVSERSSTVSISLDNGQSKSFEFGKQGIRFVSQKQRH